MSMPETLHNAADAARDYARGIDRATAIRRLFAAFVVLVVLVGGVGAGPYTVSNASPTGDTLDVSGKTGSPSGIFVGDNGTKVYVSDSGSNVIHQWNLSTAYDLSTASYHSSASTVNDAGTPTSLAFKPDGTTVLVVGPDNTAVFQYDLDTAWDIDSLSFSGNSEGTSLTSPEGITVNSSGTKLFVGDSSDIERYELSTAWNLSTASHIGTTTESNWDVVGLDWDADGERFYVFNNTGQRVAQYDVNTTYNLSSTSIDTDSPDDVADISADLGTASTGFQWADAGNVFYIADGQADEIVEFKTGFDVSGTVKYTNGTAVEGASISVNASTVSDQTDANGFYSVPLDNGTYEITAIKDIVDGAKYTGTTTVTVSGSDITDANITVTREAEVELDVPTQMFPNETASYKVYDVQADGSKVDITDSATVTSSDPTNLTVNQTSNELESTSDTSFAGEVKITATFEDDSASRNVTVANLSAGNVGLMQNAADMTAAIWGDVPDAQGDRPGGTQLTMRVLFVALLIGAAIATHASGFAGIGGITLIVVMGWFMGWVSDGMTMVTVFTGLFIGLNLAANIDYSVRSD